MPVRREPGRCAGGGKGAKMSERTQMPADINTGHETEIQHGIQAATYYGGPGEPYYQPVMECCCGWMTERSENWEEAGREFDEHLAAAAGKPAL
jgi:hypothetical protein